MKTAIALAILILATGCNHASGGATEDSVADARALHDIEAERRHDQDLTNASVSASGRSASEQGQSGAR